MSSIVLAIHGHMVASHWRCATARTAKLVPYRLRFPRDARCAPRRATGVPVVATSCDTVSAVTARLLSEHGEGEFDRSLARRTRATLSREMWCGHAIRATSDSEAFMVPLRRYAKHYGSQGATSYSPAKRKDRQIDVSPQTAQSSGQRMIGSWHGKLLHHTAPEAIVRAIASPNRNGPSPATPWRRALRAAESIG